MSKQVKCNVIKPTKPQGSAIYRMKRHAEIVIQRMDLFDNGNIIARLADGKNCTFKPDGTVKVWGNA